MTFGVDSIVRSVDGDISLIGRAGAATGVNNRGLTLDRFEVIESTGTGANAATITITGIGGSGTRYNEDAVITGDTSEIRSIDGAITLVGNGGLAGAEDGNRGLWLATSVRSLGTAPINITGTAGGGTSRNGGVYIEESGTQIVSSTGAISITGTGGLSTGDFNHGVSINAGATVTTIDAEISIVGTANSDDSPGVWLRGNESTGAQVRSLNSGPAQITAVGNSNSDTLFVEDGAGIGSDASTGDITLVADTIELGVTATVQSTGSLTIAPLASSTSIGLGRSGFGTLDLDDAELATFQDGFSSFTIGDTQLGTGDVFVQSVTFSDPVTIAGGRILDATDVDIVAPSVSLFGVINPSQSPGIFPVTQAPGILKVMGDLTLTEGSALRLEAGENTVGTYDQVLATGRVDIAADVELPTRWIPSWTALPNDRLIIVQRTGGSGTFAGLAEDAVLPDFFNAVISYVGGDGDDLVLTLPDTIPQTTVIDLSNMGTDGVTVFGVDDGDHASQSVHSAGDVNGDHHRPWRTSAVGEWRPDHSSIRNRRQQGKSPCDSDREPDDHRGQRVGSG
ncbi:MAG: hypothetical protein ABGZ23_27185 [Fuerstiella sp.]|nr:hypothetical protein [Fuerstiella sp.]